MSKICGVYGLFNTVNGRVYVGSSVDIETRSFWHKIALESLTLKSGDRRRALTRDWHKLGSKNFSFVLLERTAHFTKRNDPRLLKREQYWIDQFENLYNKTRSSTSSGRKLTLSARKKMSNHARNTGSDTEERERRSLRAKKQHQEGKLGRKTWKPETVKLVNQKIKDNFKNPQYHKETADRLKKAANNYDSAEMSRRSYCRKKYQK